MTEFKQGDRVRVTPNPYDGTVVCDGTQGRRTQVRDSEGVLHAFGPEYGTVELIERADDPSRDPVGTVRRLPSGIVVAKKQWAYGGEGWLPFESDGVYRLDRNSAGQVIGAVPGTPAWEAHEATDAEYCTPMAERPLWTGDGSEEPPAHVKAVKDKSSNCLKYLVRVPKSGWSWHSKPAWDDEDGAEGLRWVDVVYLAVGSLTEVRY